MRMKTSSPLLLLLNVALSEALPHTQQPLFDNVGQELGSVSRFPSTRDSAIQARRIMHLESIGTLSTVYPTSNSIAASENRPKDVGGMAVGLMDYFGDCEPETGNPTILAIDIATTFKNAAAGSNISLSMRWHPPHGETYSAASIPRFSLMGYLEDLSPRDVESAAVEECFKDYHADAQLWYPGNAIHVSRWTRLVVEEIYWIGGFGNVAYIGWISKKDWHSVTMDEINQCLLPGEERHKY